MLNSTIALTIGFLEACLFVVVEILTAPGSDLNGMRPGHLSLYINRLSSLVVL